MAAAWATTSDAADAYRTASLPPGTESLRSLDTTTPSILSGSDAIRYRTVFKLQAAGQWTLADAEIEALRDRSLLGHVLAQRYLHRSYKSRYDELKSWLAAYADHPDAPEIHALALARRPKGAPPPARPTGEAMVPRPSIERAPDLRANAKATPRALPPAYRARAAQLRDGLRAQIATNPDAVEARLVSPDALNLLDPSERDELRADLAEALLIAGHDGRVLINAAQVSGAAFQPAARWAAGLAAWRLGRLDEARGHFEFVARAPGLAGWNVAAAAYWAARVHLKARRPQLVNHWLAVAADHPRTFYGLLARRNLGQDVFFNFEREQLSAFDVQAVASRREGRRALGLLQVGETARAEGELRLLAGGAGPSLLPALVALADGGNMPALSLEFAAMLSNRDGRRHDHALYPAPRWEPAGGFRVDRALLFALMRQESAFAPDVRSSAGAMGLMQLMPATARAVAKRAGVALRGDGDVLDPGTNLTLAQHHVVELLNHEKIRGNLLLTAAAYNSGTGAVAKWLARDDGRDDPLLQVETLPGRQTRVFVQRVMTNYWIYRARFGQKTPDLDRLAAGQAPLYVALDPLPERVTRNAAAR